MMCYKHTFQETVMVPTPVAERERSVGVAVGGGGGGEGEGVEVETGRVTDVVESFDDDIVVGSEICEDGDEVRGDSCEDGERGEDVGARDDTVAELISAGVVCGTSCDVGLASTDEGEGEGVREGDGEGVGVGEGGSVGISSVSPSLTLRREYGPQSDSPPRLMVLALSRSR